MTDQERSESITERPADSFGRVWPEVPDDERCPECGQPDNIGDCTHEQLTYQQVRQLGGFEVKTWDQFLEATLAIFPDAEVGEDMDGQLTIYTGLISQPLPNGTDTIVVPMPDEPEVDDGDV